MLSSILPQTKHDDSQIKRIKQFALTCIEWNTIQAFSIGGIMLYIPCCCNGYWILIHFILSYFSLYFGFPPSINIVNQLKLTRNSDKGRTLFDDIKSNRLLQYKCSLDIPVGMCDCWDLNADGEDKRSFLHFFFFLLSFCSHVTHFNCVT